MMRVLKDRSQYMVDGLPEEALKTAGLWRAFDSLDELRITVTQWANRSLDS